MRLVAAVPLRVVAVALAGRSATDEREWMKVNQRYTKEEFQRDYKECSRSGNLNEPCMRQRGRLPVNPSKSEAPPAPAPTPSRGRY